MIPRRRFLVTLPVIVLLGLVIILNIPPSSAMIKCYKCSYISPLYYTEEKINYCKNFDYSEKYVVECPYSTFCMTKRFNARIVGLINGTERDCALQKNDTQFYINGRWTPHTSIANVYTEGCFKEENKGLKTSEEEKCYCKGDLCNGGSPRRPNIITVSVIVLFLAMMCR